MAVNPDSSAQLSDEEWARIARHLAGEATAAERAALDSWAAADPARRVLVDELTAVWERTGRLPARGVDVDAAWQVMARRIAAAADSPTGSRPAPRPPHAFAPPRWRPAIALAASLLVLLGGVGVWLQFGNDASTGASAQAFVTAAGERRTIRLADSTEVVLGVASRLEVAAGYGSGARDLSLQGEALFRVRHDAARPFRVTAGGAVTEDLGTAFAIRAYRPGDTVRVVVTEGSVALRAQGARSGGALVRAGESGILPPGGAAAVMPTANPDAAIAWSRGELTFEDAPLARVAEELGRWFDIDVALGDSALGTRRLTTSFAGDSLGAVLNVIELTLGVRAERNGRVVTLRATGPARR